MGRVDYAKLKTNLRLIVNRLKLLEKKKTELALKARREIADYIQACKDDRARIRVEHIIREDYLVEAMEMVEMYADLLLARFGLIQSQKELDPGLEEPISSILWAAPRLQADVPEFREITEQLTAKYGKEFAEYSRSNKLETVNEKLIHKLGVQAPPKILVERYMMEIAKSFNLEFTPDAVVMAQDEVYQADGTLIHLDGVCTGGGAGGGGTPADPRKAGIPMGPGMAASNEGYYCTLQPLPQPPSAIGQQHVPPPMLPPMPPVGQPGATPYHPGMHAAPPYLPSQPPHPGMHRQPFDGNLSSASAPGADSPAPPYSSLSNGQGFASAPPSTPGGGGAGPLPSKGGNLGLPDLPAVPSSLPSLPPGGGTSGGNDVDFDDLTRRFEELKKKK